MGLIGKVRVRVSAVAVAITLLGAFLGTGACTLLFRTSEQQCTTNAECTQRGPTFLGAICTNNVCVTGGGVADTGADTTGVIDDAGADGPFDCIDKNPLPKPEKPTTHVNLRFIDLFDQTLPVTSIKLSVCTNLTDPNCTSPALVKRPDADGRVELDVDTSVKAFDGYLDIDPVLEDGGAPDTTGADQNVYVPSRIYFTSYPLFRDHADFYLLLKFSAATQFSTLFGLPYDSTAGNAFLLSDDCHGFEQPGFSFLIDSTGPETRSFYFVNLATPSTTATQTDPSGTGGFVNVPPGARTFTVTNATTKKPIGSLTGYVRPNTIMYGRIQPTFTR